MQAQIPDQYGLAGMERLSQIPPKEEKGFAISGISVYINYE